MSTILVVDDDPRNRALLRGLLENAGTIVVEAGSGEEALVQVRRAQPDLVLLDVMMPGLDGYITTQRIKQVAGSSFLPVILVTALSQREARLRGLAAGADDFLSKPIDLEELEVRVRNLLALREKELTLRQRNVQMLELLRFRDDMSDLLIHDLKNPTAIVEMSLDYLQSESPPLEASVAEAVADARLANQRIARIVNNMLDLARLESQRLVLRRAPTRPAALMGGVAQCRAALVRQHQVTLELELDEKLEVDVDVDLMTRVIENIVDNSLQHVPSGGRIWMRAEGREDVATMFIGNDGPPVPPQMREAIFEKFTCGEASPSRRNLGLGLYFCRLAMEAHGGRIWVSDRPLPTVFGIELPRGTLPLRSWLPAAAPS
jgi:two-component system, sensor histidine kinase and response regulator